MDTTPLTAQKCIPCEGGVEPFTPEQIAIYKDQTPEWKIIENHHIEREFKFKNFKEALSFINKVGDIAENEGHHPDINLHGWNKVTFTLFTHAIDGLYLNDFILAAKIDALLHQ
jgi:4a-hydroxytetrahydrobiopterin dehydratase